MYNLLDTSAPDICKSRILGSKASTPEDEGEEGATGNGDAGSSETGDDEMNVSAAVGVNSANPVKKSDYEHT